MADLTWRDLFMPLIAVASAVISVFLAGRLVGNLEGQYDKRITVLETDSTRIKALDQERRGELALVRQRTDAVIALEAQIRAVADNITRVEATLSGQILRLEGKIDRAAERKP